MSDQITVLVVDDEEDIRLLVTIVLRAAGLEVVDEAADGPRALAAIDALDAPETPTVVLLDNRMPGLSGMEVAAQVLAREPRQKIVLFSAHLDDATRKAAAALGVSACVGKTDASKLPEVIRGIIEGADVPNEKGGMS